jgi:hypothetical protein
VVKPYKEIDKKNWIWVGFSEIVLTNSNPDRIKLIDLVRDTVPHLVHRIN